MNSTIRILIILLISIAILFFLIRYILLCLSIKSKSELYTKVKNLNNEYKSLFHTVQKKNNINYECNNLQQYKDNSNKTAIINYMCGRIKDNKDVWQDLYTKVNQNKNILKKYIEDYELLKKEFGGKNFEEIKKKTFLFSENQYLKFEDKYCQRKMIKPQTTLNIVVKLSYSSPADKNHYSSEYVLKNESIDEIFKKIDS